MVVLSRSIYKVWLSRLLNYFRKSPSISIAGITIVAAAVRIPITVAVTIAAGGEVGGGQAES
jgi:hypothetical protein